MRPEHKIAISQNAQRLLEVMKNKSVNAICDQTEAICGIISRFIKDPSNATKLHQWRNALNQLSNVKFLSLQQFVDGIN